jgi:hypothetical protein
LFALWKALNYYSEVFIPFSSVKWDKKYPEYPVDPVKKSVLRKE